MDNKLVYLWHPNTTNVFSGYGLEVRPGRLTGLLMVDRPGPVDEAWLQSVQDVFGSYDLYAMTQSLERGLACVMFVGVDSTRFLRDDFEAPGLAEALSPLLEHEPRPRLNVRWDAALKLWTSEFRTEGTV